MGIKLRLSRYGKNTDRMYENRVQRRIFGQNAYYLPNTIRMIKSRWVRWAGHVARTGEIRTAYTTLVGELEGKRPLGRSGSR
jgi:hypothetical protein